MWSLRHFVALYARILILRTEHVRCRGGQQQRQQIAAYAAACEFVARLWGESEGDEHGAVYQPRSTNCEKRHRSISLKSSVWPLLGGIRRLPEFRGDCLRGKFSTASPVHGAVEVCTEHRSGTRNVLPGPQVRH